MTSRSEDVHCRLCKEYMYSYYDPYGEREWKPELCDKCKKTKIPKPVKDKGPN